MIFMDNKIMDIEKFSVFDKSNPLSEWLMGT